MFSCEILLLHNDPSSANQWTGFYINDGDLRHELNKNFEKLKWRQREFPASSFHVAQTLQRHSEITLFHSFEGVELIRFMPQIALE